MSDDYKPDPEYFTLIIKGDILKIKSPIFGQTPYGECVGIAIGSLFEERDHWEARAIDAEEDVGK
jgi:hypothetical protein